MIGWSENKCTGSCSGVLVFVSTALIAGAIHGGTLDGVDIDVHGFLDVRGGTRTQVDPYEKDTSLAETRLQLEVERVGDLSTIQVRAGFLYDDVPEDTLDLRRGKGAVDLREANLLVSPLDSFDIKIGRQILTWGTGDLLFVNDMFPKDWQSFFIGRDQEYLKAPSDAVFVSLFPAMLTVDVAYSPRFDSDRYISGERISYWNPMLGRRVGRDAVVDPEISNDWFDEDEVSARISGNAGGYELALYGYDGYWKNPVGLNPDSGRAYFPELAVYGASVRGSLGKGIVNVEAGYYDSGDDGDGDDPLIPNSEQRYLVGYERELARNLSLGLQCYLEHMEMYGRYEGALQEGANEADEDRVVITIRLTKRVLSQNLVLSLFAYCSPTDEDVYLRPIVTYKATDEFEVMAGGNVFMGNEDHTFFGQFEKNTNVYGGARYSF